MRIGGRAVPDYVAVFLVSDQGPDCLLVLRSEGADGSGAASSSLSGWRRRGCSAPGRGLQQPLQSLVPLGSRACVSHYLSFSFLWEKIRKSQRMRRGKRAVRVIIVLIPQSAPQYKARCDLFRPSPRHIQVAWVSSYTHLCQTEPLHICSKRLAACWCVWQHWSWRVLVERTPDRNLNDLGYSPDSVMD